jgi:hypothetical protein
MASIEGKEKGQGKSVRSCGYKVIRATKNPLFSALFSYFYKPFVLVT